MPCLLVLINSLLVLVDLILDFYTHALHARAHLVELVHQTLHLFCVTFDRVSEAQKVGDDWRGLIMKQVMITVQCLRDFLSVSQLEFHFVVFYLRLKVQIVEDWRFTALDFVECLDGVSKSFFSPSGNRLKEEVATFIDQFIEGILFDH